MCEVCFAVCWFFSEFNSKSTFSVQTQCDTVAVFPFRCTANFDWIVRKLAKEIHCCYATFELIRHDKQWVAPSGWCQFSCRVSLQKKDAATRWRNECNNLLVLSSSFAEAVSTALEFTPYRYANFSTSSKRSNFSAIFGGQLFHPHFFKICRKTHGWEPN